MIVEEAALSDLPDIVALEAWFPDKERWSENAWREEVEGRDRHVLVGRDATTGATIAAATFQISDDVVDLHRIVVAEPYRRRGLARVMIMSGLHWAKRNGATRMLLEVRADNRNAIRLYRDFGFNLVAERRDYYGTGADARVCQLDLADVDLDRVSPWSRREPA